MLIFPHYIKLKIRNYLKKFSFITKIYSFYTTLKSKDIFCKRAKIINNGYGSIQKMIVGRNNVIVIWKNTKTNNTIFHIIGENNTIEIGDNCCIGKGCSFWMEGNNIRIKIGSETTFTQYCHFNAQENGSSIEVGEGCMFSNKIIVRTSDSHPIYDIKTGKRINPALPVKIGNKVWIAPDSKIMKGADIGDGCIIGSNTMVGKVIPAHSLAVGMPAKVVKNGIKWTREDVILKKNEYGQ